MFLWDVATAQTLKRYSGHAGRINACAWGGEGDTVIISGEFGCCQTVYKILHGWTEFAKDEGH